MVNFDSKLGFFDQPVIRRILWAALGWFLVSGLWVSASAAFAVYIGEYRMCVLEVECINFYFFDVLKVPFAGLAGQSG